MHYFCSSLPAFKKFPCLLSMLVHPSSKLVLGAVVTGLWCKA